MSIQSMTRAWSIIGQVGLPAFGTNVIVPIATFFAVAIIGNVLGEVEVFLRMDLSLSRLRD